MTFEEWFEQDANGYQEDEHGYLTAKRAWEAAFEEGYKFANKENEEYDKIGV